jgi:hypothetical protein
MRLPENCLTCPKSLSNRDLFGQSFFKGVTAGIIGGLVASWVMEEFQAAWLKLSEAFEEEKRKTAIGNTG